MHVSCSSFCLDDLSRKLGRRGNLAPRTFLSERQPALGRVKGSNAQNIIEVASETQLGSVHLNNRAVMVCAFERCSQHIPQQIHSCVFRSSPNQRNRESSRSSSHLQSCRALDYVRDEFLFLLVDVSSARSPKPGSIIIRSFPIIVGFDNGSRSDSLCNQE